MVPPRGLSDLRAAWRGRTIGLALLALAVTLVLLALVLRDAQERELDAGRFAALLLAIVALLLSARALVAWAIPAGWHWSPPPRGLDSAWLRSPADWLATALLALALVALLFDLVARGRVSPGAPARGTPSDSRCGSGRRRRRLAPLVGLVLAAHAALLSGVVRAPDSHGLSFGVYPLDARRLVLVIGLLCANAAALWLAVAVLRLAASWWRVRRGGYGRRLAMGAVFVGAALYVAGRMGTGPLAPRLIALLPPLALVLAATGASRWIIPRYRHASQAARLTVAYLALVLPTVALYPALVSDEQAALEHTIAAEYAPEVLNHRDELRVRLSRSREQLDAVPVVAAQFVADVEQPGAPPDASRAFFLWSQTELGRQRLTSSVELYDATGGLVSRFALNLPAEFLATERPVEAECAWDVFGEAQASTDDSGAAACRPGRLSARWHEGRGNSRARRARLRDAAVSSPTAIRRPRSRAAARSRTTRRTAGLSRLLCTAGAARRSIPQRAQRGRSAPNCC